MSSNIIEIKRETVIESVTKSILWRGGEMVYAKSVAEANNRKRGNGKINEGAVEN